MENSDSWENSKNPVYIGNEHSYATDLESNMQEGSLSQSQVTALTVTIDFRIFLQILELKLK